MHLPLGLAVTKANLIIIHTNSKEQGFAMVIIQFVRKGVNTNHGPNLNL